MNQIVIPAHIDPMDALTERLNHLEAKGRITASERQSLSAKLQAAKAKRPDKPEPPNKPAKP